MEARSQVIKAIAVIQRPRDGALLVSEDVDPSRALFHRPLGGHVEFGEYALDTVQREFLEEIGQVLTDTRPAGVVENMFQWDGTARHEIVFVFTAGFADEAAYEIHEQVVRDSRRRIRVTWRPPGACSPPLYPAAAAAIAARSSGQPTGSAGAELRSRATPAPMAAVAVRGGLP